MSAILDRLANGTLIRKAWVGLDASGRETACLLAAIAPECGAAKGAAHCPADVMPAWLAHLTPWIDDAGTEAAWASHVREYAALAPHFGRLTSEPATGRRALVGVLRVVVAEALSHGDPDGVVSTVLALLDREWCGGVVTVEEYAAAAYAAAEAAAEAAYAAARAAARAAEAAARAAEAAAYAAAYAAYAAARAAYAAARAAAADAADRMISGILAVLRDVLQVQP